MDSIQDQTQSLSDSSSVSSVESVSSASGNRESELRRQIQDIHNNPNLSLKEKAQKMQELMFGRSIPKRPPSRVSEISLSSASNSPTLSEEHLMQGIIVTDEDRLCTFSTTAINEGNPILGCSHYRTNCKVRAECCENWYTCRFCHDEKEDHPIDRYVIRFMLCMFCQTVQPASSTCRGCKKLMASYFCSICNLWDDEPNRSIFHCEKCNICRRGNRQDYIHCDKCHGCITSDFYPKHKCHEGSLQSNCPICGENLFSTTSGVMFMPCGHAIHYLCHQEHTRNSYQCPICLKSLSNMTEFFNRIDEFMRDQKMPEDYAKTKAQILCNDCEKKSVTKFHFVYHRCEHCKSYNTKVLKQFIDNDTKMDIDIEQVLESDNQESFDI